MTIMQSVLFVIATLGNSASFTLYYAHPSIATGFLVLFTSLYTLIGLHDLFISKHSLNRLYPVVAYIRYFLENFRTEIQQYFIANNTEELPFNREQRSLVYQRAKNQRDTIAFGTQHNLLEDNYLSLWPSLSPKKVEHENKRITIGGTQCNRPYDASILNISAMSFGALSAQAIEALNLGAQKGGFYHNTGEGGISPYHLKHGGDLVWQIGSGLFGCRDLDGKFDPSLFTQNARRENVKMVELKLSQGAKPGHGGVLPKSKISEEIARIRNVPMDQDCISPASHPLAQTPIDLLNNITQLRELSGGKPVGFKMCVGNPAEFLSICKAMLESNQYPDFITIDGAEGGTGAAPVEFSNRLGMTCLDAVYLVNSALIGCGIRDKITLIASGKTASAFDILTKIAAGANIINAARTMMFAIGCIQSRSCNTNHCPTGVATQDPARGKAIDIAAKSERVKNFQRNTLHALFELVGSMGLDDPQAVTANMVKRRTPYGLSISLGAIVPTLKPNSLLQKLNTVDDPWQRWWQQANSESFYVHDDCVLYSPELKMREV